MQKSPTKRNITLNTHIEEIREAWYGRDEKSVWPLWLDDIVSGICRLDWYGDREQQIPLSTLKLITVLTELEEISTATVGELLGLKDAMARKYSTAARLAYPHIVRSLNDREVTSMKYPQRSIVSVAHGEFLGYAGGIQTKRRTT